MLAYTFYETDGRVIRYAEALAESGATVDVIALGREGQPRTETLNGVNVIRVQNRKKNESGKLSYLTRILTFLIRSFIEVTRRNGRARYDLVHVHSVPDFEIFAAAIVKWSGARLILDIHDIVPEFYSMKFSVKPDSFVVKALIFAERMSTAFADHVIIANDLWRGKLVARSVPDAKCTSYINYPDRTVFREDLPRREADGRFLISYPGSLNWHQGLDIAIRAVGKVVKDAPGIHLQIIGEGGAKPQLAALVEELGLSDHVSLHEPVPLREVARVMARADLGVVPKRDDSFGGEAFSTKILEFMSVGTPVVVAATRVDKHYFDDSMVRFFKPGDADDLARAFLEMYRDREQGTRLSARAIEHARANDWSRKKLDYLALVRRLVTPAFGRASVES